MGARFGLAGIQSAPITHGYMLILETVASAIYQHDLSSQLERIGSLLPRKRDGLSLSAIEILGVLAQDVQDSVRDAYTHGLRMVSTSFTAFSSACAKISLLIKVNLNL